ncbi:hypothetical protein ABZP36_010372 [Zizania latifolia]
MRDMLMELDDGDPLVGVGLGAGAGIAEAVMDGELHRVGLLEDKAVEDLAAEAELERRRLKWSSEKTNSAPEREMRRRAGRRLRRRRRICVSSGDSGPARSQERGGGGRSCCTRDSRQRRHGVGHTQSGSNRIDWGRHSRQ